jgi:hypothetical protein
LGNANVKAPEENKTNEEEDGGVGSKEQGNTNGDTGEKGKETPTQEVKPPTKTTTTKGKPTKKGGK